MIYSTIPEMFIKICEKFADNSRAAFLYKVNSEFVSITHNELRQKVECLALGLMELGIRKSDRIGLVSENRIEWIISSLAINLLGAVDVPLFPILSAKQEEDIFNDCQVSSVFVSNNFQLKKILEIKDSVPSLRQVIILNDEYDNKEVFIHKFNEIINRGFELRNENDRRTLIRDQINKIETDDILTLIYTSGTTGKPKGVMLSHANILSNIEGALFVLGDFSKDTSLMFLPLCHSYERTGGFYSLFISGTKIAIAESIESVPIDIIEIKPTVMTTVPRLLETVKKKILNKMEKEPKSKQLLFNWALKIGKNKFINRQNGKNNPFVNSLYEIADKLVFSKIKNNLGGRLTRFISGGAALSNDVEVFFESVGIFVLQGYGLTEASPIVSSNRLEETEIGTIGKPIFNVSVKIAEDGEILVKGPNVMKGYWNDPVSTRLAIDEEGWLYTGDIGQYTLKGNLKITDRKKDIFVSSGGKNIAPQLIENLITQSRFIDHCVIIGDNKEYISALLTPNFDQMKLIAQEFGIEYSNLSELISNAKIVEHFRQEINFYQKDLSKFEKIRKFQLLSEPFSVNGGELSPKMSIRRHIVERKYHDLIELMYN
jgi:long-chain acyl-CoA synthetase